MQAYDSRKVTHDGREFVARFYYDDSHDAPWEREDGHGPVTGWERRDKRPGEWIINEDRGSRRFYDAQEAQRIALRDGWGCPPDAPYEPPSAYMREAEARAIAQQTAWGFTGGGRINRRAALACRDPLGEWLGMTQREIAARAVRADFARLRDWCNDGWHYCGVSVSLVTPPEDPDEFAEEPEETFAYALWGIESDAGDYFAEVIAELCREALADEARRTYPVHSLGT
jgi:hypothetical protein